MKLMLWIKMRFWVGLYCLMPTAHTLEQITSITMALAKVKTNACLSAFHFGATIVASHHKVIDIGQEST